MPLQSRMIILTTIFTLLFCHVSLAQYGGGTPGPMGTATPAPGTPGYVAPSHGYKANPALIGGLVGGAAAGGGLFYYIRHHNVYQGCVGSDGTTLIREKDGKQFKLEGTLPLPAGEKVSLKAKKSAADSSGSTLEVEKVRKDLGRCERETAARK